MKQLKPVLKWLVVIVSLSLAGCDRPGMDAKELLRTSTSFGYIGTARYLDGGSFGFIFTNQNAKLLLVFVPNPWAAEGVVTKNGKKVQKVLISHTKEPASDELLELPWYSKTEARIMQLVRSALQQNLPEEKREEIFSLLEVLATRSFDWDSVEKSGGVPRAKGHAVE
jgi:hypothetical protein